MADFVRVAGVTDVPDPGSMLVEVEGEMIALFHVGGQFSALDDVCTHDGGPLASGELTGTKIACPRHGARFDIRTGAALSMPAIRGTRSHDVKIDAGGVWIRLRSGHGIDGPVTQPIGYPGSPHVETPESESLTLPSVPATGATDGAAPVEATALTTAASDTAPLCEDRVRELLKTVKDPELFVNIVDLGLIYGVTLAPSAEVSGKQQVSIDMTMTSPACPAGPQLIGDTKRALAAHPAVAGVEVRIVMDPPWTPDRMTDDARDFLGIF